MKKDEEKNSKGFPSIEWALASLSILLLAVVIGIGGIQDRIAKLNSTMEEILTQVEKQTEHTK